MQPSPNTQQAQKGVLKKRWDKKHLTNVLLMLVSIGVVIRIYQLQRPIKQLAFDVISNAPMVSVQDDVRGHLRVLYDGHPVSGVNLLILRVENTGNVAIEEKDYVRPLTFSFGVKTKATILSAQVTKSKPGNIGETLTRAGQTIALKPVLLNPGDAVDINLLLTGGDNKMVPDERIVGISDIERKDLTTPGDRRPVLTVSTVSWAVILLSMLLMMLGMERVLQGALKFILWLKRKGTH